MKCALSDLGPVVTAKADMNHFCTSMKAVMKNAQMSILVMATFNESLMALYETLDTFWTLKQTHVSPRILYVILDIR